MLLLLPLLCLQCCCRYYCKKKNQKTFPDTQKLTPPVEIEQTPLFDEFIPEIRTPPVAPPPFKRKTPEPPEEIQETIVPLQRRPSQQPRSNRTEEFGLQVDTVFCQFYVHSDAREQFSPSSHSQQSAIK